MVRSNISRHAHSICRATQRRWARVHDVRFVTTQHAQEQIIDRYRQKLDEKVKREGLSDIGELKEAYKDKITNLRNKAILPENEDTPSNRPPNDAGAVKVQPSVFQSPPSPPSAEPLDEIVPTSPFHKPPGLKTLDSFIDVGKTLQLPSKEIEAIWRLRHARSPQSLCAAVPSSTWRSIYRTARKNPLFILPGLPRDKDNAENVQPITPDAANGAPIHFMQWSFPSRDTATVMFTHLAEYKLRGEYAQPHTTLTHHLELEGPKGLVLCQGSVIEGRGVSVEEGKWLIMNMQKFYNVGEDVEQQETSSTGRELKKRRRRLVELFASGDESFKLEDLIQEAERIG